MPLIKCKDTCKTKLKFLYPMRFYASLRASKGLTAPVEIFVETGRFGKTAQ